MDYKKIKNFLFEKKFLLAFIALVSVGMYLRFYNFENAINFGWDQARDAWKTSDIIFKYLLLDGPKTGVGQFHLGPLWFYLLVPFFRLTNLDPVGEIYLNILVNIFNFIAIFWVTKKIYNEKAALFVTMIYTFSRYMIGLNQVPWNVSPVPGVAILIFYGIYSVVFENNYKWIPIMAFLTGLFFHLHFSVVFLIPIILISLLFAKNKIKVITRGLLSLPLFIFWLIPTIVYQIQSKNSDISLFSSFLKDYWVGGFHLRFFISRLDDAFVQFRTILTLPVQNKILIFIVPAIFIIALFFEKDKKTRLLGFLMLLWFVVPAIMYSFYGGATTEYYVLINMPMVLYIIYYLQNKLLKLNPKPLILSGLVLLWLFYIYSNTFDWWVKPTYGGLHKAKDEIKEMERINEKYPFNEGDIKAYLYFMCIEHNKLCYVK